MPFSFYLLIILSRLTRVLMRETLIAVCKGHLRSKEVYLVLICYYRTSSVLTSVLGNQKRQNITFHKIMLSLINYIFSLQLIVIDPKLSSSIRSYVIQGLNSNQIWPFTPFFLFCFCYQ